jgi:hypothetical protein
MPKEYPNTSKRIKPEDESGSESEGDVEYLNQFVPGERIDAGVLVDYVVRYIDRRARINAAGHPTV